MTVSELNEGFFSAMAKSIKKSFKKDFDFIIKRNFFSSFARKVKDEIEQDIKFDIKTLSKEKKYEIDIFGIRKADMNRLKKLVKNIITQFNIEQFIKNITYRPNFDKSECYVVLELNNISESDIIQIENQNELLLEYWVQKLNNDMERKGTKGAFTKQCKDMGFRKASYNCIKASIEKADKILKDPEAKKEEKDEARLLKKRAVLARTFKKMAKNKKQQNKG